MSAAEVVPAGWVRVNSQTRIGQWFYRNELAGYTVTFSVFQKGWVSSGGLAAGVHSSAGSCIARVDALLVEKVAK
jgi:hypothetical protein